MDVDEAHQEEEIVPHPHEILWYPDGDVVLATDTLLFKVHKLILSLQSSVFRDMFAFPAVDGVQDASNGNGAGVQETYEGLPMVVLIGDKGKEVAHLLRTVYERSYYYRDDDGTPLEKITALLVLSTKYDFRRIRSDVILQISRKYPISLKGYLGIDDDWAEMFGTRRMDCHYPLLNAVLKADVECLLPLLYYACSDYLMQGVLQNSRRLSMDPQSIIVLISGRDALKDRINSIVKGLPDEVRESAAQSCSSPTPKPCRKVAYFTGLDATCNTSDLGELNGKSIASAAFLKRACENCATHIAKFVDKKREEIWNELPSLFGLRCWKDLKEELAKLS
ncbi:hypothetical protein SCHPADRAFT_931822 [Schizopora paradoxa]|uniref:BTB domain-containing protein n=1 Tax=Schizopora paradoxa TaxID=27342 RepID=A0A0H2RFW3_9AGAM|nr:hypothetical protein SCHPADRAFT_931822 [Schizopora paradoxa]